MSKAIAEFADEMLQHFPPFRQWEDYQEKAWADTLATELAGFSNEVLLSARKQIIRTRKPNMPRPPMVSECIDACVEARRFIEKDKRASELPEFNPSAGADWTSERIKLAYELCKGTQIGKEAARDGWILSLWHFCREKQRVPTTQTEIAACKRAAKEFDETYDKCVKGGWPEAKKWEALGASMLAKREKLAGEVLGR